MKDHKAPERRQPAPSPTGSATGAQGADKQALLGNAAIQEQLGTARNPAAQNLAALSDGYGMAGTGLRVSSKVAGGAAGALGGLMDTTGLAGATGKLGAAGGVWQAAGGTAQLTGALMDEGRDGSERVLDGMEGGANVVGGVGFANPWVAGPANALNAGLKVGRSGDKSVRELGIFKDAQGRPESASEMAANGAWSAKEYVEGLTGSSTLGHVTGALTGVPLAAAGALAATGSFLGETAAKGTILGEELYDRLRGGQEHGGQEKGGKAGGKAGSKR